MSAPYHHSIIPAIEKSEVIVQVLEPETIAKFIQEHPEWKVEGKNLFVYLLSKVLARRWISYKKMRSPINVLRHHPEWANVYNRLAVALITHEVNGITDLGIALAKAFHDRFSKSP